MVALWVFTMNLFSELVLETDEETGNQSNKLIKDFIGGFLCALGSKSTKI